MRRRPHVVVIVALGVVALGIGALLPAFLGGVAGPALIAVSLVLGPLGVGFELGRVVARWPWRSVIALALAVAAPLAALGLATSMPDVGTWDLISVGVLAGVGILFGAGVGATPRAGELLLVLGSTLLCLLVVELGARWLMGPAPPWPPAREASLVLTRSARGPACDALYPDELPDLFQTRTTGLPDGERTLHVGDSMVEGESVQPDQAFPAVLTAMGDDGTHINAGVRAVGPDYYLQVVRQWTARLAVRRVVVHLFLGNDLDNIDLGYHCCMGGPLLDYSDGAPRSNCPEPRWGFSTAQLLETSPAPYPLRVATGFSAAASTFAWPSPGCPPASPNTRLRTRTRTRTRSRLASSRRSCSPCATNWRPTTFPWSWWSCR